MSDVRGSLLESCLEHLSKIHDQQVCENFTSGDCEKFKLEDLDLTSIGYSVFQFSIRQFSARVFLLWIPFQKEVASRQDWMLENIPDILVKNLGAGCYEFLAEILILLCEMGKQAEKDKVNQNFQYHDFDIECNLGGDECQKICCENTLHFKSISCGLRLISFLQQTYLRMIKRCRSIMNESKIIVPPRQARLKARNVMRNYLIKDEYKNWIQEEFMLEHDLDYCLEVYKEKVDSLTMDKTYTKKILELATFVEKNKLISHLTDDFLLQKLLELKQMGPIYKILGCDLESENEDEDDVAVESQSEDERKIDEIHQVIQSKKLLVINLMAQDEKLIKTALKSLKKFKLDIRNFPNLLIEKKKRAVLDIPVFKVMDFLDDLADSLEMQIYILEFLFKKKRYHDVLTFCKEYDLLNLEIAEAITKQRIYEIYSKSEKASIGSFNQEQALNDFIQSRNPILFVNDPESFEIASHKILNSPDRTIAFDSEQRIRLLDYHAHVVSIMQLSLRNYNFIFDMLAFEKYSEKWSALFREIFKSQAYMKIGFGITADQLIFKRCFPDHPYFWSWENCVDLQDFDFGQEPSPQRIGLAKACELKLQAKLNKSETVSNWLRRPLTASQLEYAALDSEILFALYDSIQTR